MVRGRWNADTKAVFLDEYDDEGNVTTAKINGFVSFEKQTLVRSLDRTLEMALSLTCLQLYVSLIASGRLAKFFQLFAPPQEATDEDGDLWQFKFVQSLEVQDPRK